MKTQWFKVTLESDLVVSARWVTTGGHHGLDYLPGSLFLGAVADCFKHRGEDFDAELLLSGRLRVGPFYPWLEGKLALPAPLCWHTVKKKPEDGIFEDGIFNGLVKSPSEWDDLAKAGDQPVQLRGGYVTTENPPRLVVVGMSHRLKTAIDPKSFNRAMEAQLFGYQSIQAGAVFAGRVELGKSGEDEREFQEKWNSVLACFAGGALRLGRSRTAEYGRVKIETIPAPALPDRRPESQTGGLVHLYLLSDMAIARQGTPTLEPLWESLAPGTNSNAEVLWNKSFARTRSYAPWNEFYRTHDVERVVLSRGSVITLKPKEPFPWDQVQTVLGAAVGSHRNEGLGRVLLNPDFLFFDGGRRELDRVDMPGKAEAPLSNLYPTSAAKNPNSKNPNLIAFLRKKRTAVETEADAERLGVEWAGRIGAAIKEVKRRGEKAPGPTQWEAIRHLAQVHARGGQDLREAVEEYIKTSAFRKRVWGAGAGGLLATILGLLSNSRTAQNQPLDATVAARSLYCAARSLAIKAKERSTHERAR